MNREIGRLRMSLDAAEPGLEKLVFLHYPPVYTGTSAPEIVATLKEYSIRTCYYGHLHGNAIRYAVQGDVDGIHYKLVSADGLRFARTASIEPLKPIKLTIWAGNCVRSVL